jgi:MarR family transcriptional regulator, transcriptional regulator for hemolysin
MALPPPTAKLDLGDYLPYLVNRVGNIIADQFGEEALAPHGLSIDSSTLSRLVTRLVRLGLVARTRSTSSNREVAVKLSAKGGALVAQLIPIGLEFESAAIAGLSPAELMTFKRCLRRMYTNMKARPAAAGTARPKRAVV